MNNTYTKEEFLEAIRKAFYDGVEAGRVDYGDENFVAEDYLPDTPSEATPEPLPPTAETDPRVIT